jgi:hypothetical protein
MHIAKPVVSLAIRYRLLGGVVVKQRSRFMSVPERYVTDDVIEDVCCCPTPTERAAAIGRFPRPADAQ